MFGDCVKLTSISYLGTIAQWNAIKKGYYWNVGCEAWAAVHCIDGDVDNHYVPDEDEPEDPELEPDPDSNELDDEEEDLE